MPCALLLFYAPDTFGVGISLVGLVDHTLSALVASAVIRLVASSYDHPSPVLSPHMVSVRFFIVGQHLAHVPLSSWPLYSRINSPSRLFFYSSLVLFVSQVFYSGGTFGF